MIYKTNSGDIELNTILIDLNGTLTVSGILDERIPALISQLKWLWFRLILLTGDQRGNSQQFESIGLEVVLAWNAQAKKEFALTCDITKTIAIGNARIDIWMFEVCKLRIATLQWEWIHAAILPYVDIIVPDMVNALQMFIDTDIFAATMKI